MARLFLTFLCTIALLSGQTGDPEEHLGAVQRAIDSGEFSRALTAADAAVALLDQKFVPPLQTHQILVAQAEVLAILGEYAKAEVEAEKVGATASEPDSAARALIVKARARAFVGDFNAAQQDLQWATRYAEQETRLSVLVAAARVEVLLEAGKPQEAAAELRQWGTRGSRPAEMSRAAVAVALATGDYAQAESLLAASPSRSDRLGSMQMALLKARLLGETARSGAAQAQFGAACRDYADRLGSEHPASARCWAVAGVSAYWSGRNSAAASLLLKAAAALARYPGRQPLAVLRELVAGYQAANEGNAGEAHTHWDRARAGYVSLYGESSPAMAEVDLPLAAEELDSDKPMEAENRLNRVNSVLSFARPEQTLRLRTDLLSARCAARQQDWRRVETLLSSWRKNHPANGESDSEFAAGLAIEADAVYRLGQTPDAESLLARSIEVWHAIAELRPATLVPLYTRLADIRAALNKPAEAAQTVTEILGVASSSLSAPERVALLEKAAGWRESAGQYGEAADTLMRLVNAGGGNQLSLMERSAKLLRAAHRDEDANDVLRRDLEIRNRAGGATSAEAVEIEAELAQSESARGNFAGALPLWEQLAAAGRNGIGIGARNRRQVLERLAEAQEKTGNREPAAGSWMQLARLVMLQNDLDAAETFANRARGIAPSGSPEIASSFQLLAAIRSQSPNAQDVESYLRRFLELVAGDPGGRAVGLSEMARLYVKNDPRAADTQSAEAEALVQKVEAAGPRATVLAARGFVLAQQGKTEQAERKYNDFVVAETEMDYDHDFPLFSLLAEASRFYAPRNQMAKVEEIGRRRLVATEAAFGKRSAETGRAMQSLALTLSKVNKFGDARGIYDNALAVFRALSDNADAGSTLASIGDWSRQQGKLPDALQSYKAAVAEDPNQEKELLPRVAALEIETGAANDAVDSYTKLAELWKEGAPNPQWIDANRGLCVALVRSGKAKEALDALKSLRASIQAANGKKPSITELNVLRAIVEAFSAIGRAKDGAALDREAKAMAKKLNVS